MAKSAFPGGNRFENGDLLFDILAFTSGATKIPFFILRKLQNQGKLGAAFFTEEFIRRHTFPPLCDGVLQYIYFIRLQGV